MLLISSEPSFAQSHRERMKEFTATLKESISTRSGGYGKLSGCCVSIFSFASYKGFFKPSEKGVLFYIIWKPFHGLQFSKVRTLWFRKKRKWKWNIFFSQSDAFCWSCDVRKEYFFGISSKFCNKEWDCRGCQEETVILSYVLHICAKHLLPKDFILQIHPKGKYHCWRSSRSCNCSQCVK